MGRENKIHFTDSGGNPLFAVPDGGIIRMVYGNGDEYFALCRYVDETHAEIDGVRHSLAEFAEKMERNKISYAPA